MTIRTQIAAVSLAAVVLLAASPACAADVQAEAQAAVGSAVPRFSEMAKKTARGSLYVFGGLLAMLALVRRFKGAENTKTAQAITLLARRSMGNRSSLLLVQVEGRKLLLAQSADSISLLTPLEPAFEISDSFESDTLRLAQGG